MAIAEPSVPAAAGSPRAHASRALAAAARQWQAVGTTGIVVHLLGEASDNMLAFFGPVTTALADSGLQQTVILLDKRAQRRLLPGLDARVRLVLYRAHRGRLKSLRALLQLLDEETRSAPNAVVHLHGVLPCLLGGYAARFRGLNASLVFTPYGKGLSHPLDWGAAMLLRALRPRSGEAARSKIITSRATEVDALQQVTGQPVDLVEGSVAADFFVGTRREARRPLVVTATRAEDPRGAALFAQLAVLLGEEALGLSFNWIGPADTESRAQFQAAGVGLLNGRDESTRLIHLRSAWLYVATDSASRFPTCLVEAMAMGLPCVAWATPQHREVLRHGETGLLCSSDDELLTCVASLVDSPAQRLALGQAAREEALRRFHPSRFSASMLAAYDTSPARLSP